MPGPHGVPVQDYGSNGGDCGLRCLAATQALRNGIPADQVQAKIAKLAQSLRVKVHLWLQENKGWRDAWSADPDSTESTEGGPCPNSAAGYLDSVARPTKWVDHYMCMAASRVLLCDIVVWKFVANQWKFMARIQPPSASKGPPVCLFLRHGHFTTLPSGVKMPPSWKDFEPTADEVVVSFHGGGRKGCRSTKSCEPADDSRSSNLSAWLRPVKRDRLVPEDAPGSFAPQGSDNASEENFSHWLRPVGPACDKARATAAASSKNTDRGSQAALTAWLRPVAKDAVNV